jgi:hypothetical protein
VKQASIEKIGALAKKKGQWEKELVACEAKRTELERTVDSNNQDMRGRQTADAGIKRGLLESLRLFIETIYQQERLWLEKNKLERELKSDEPGAYDVVRPLFWGTEQVLDRDARIQAEEEEEKAWGELLTTY